MKNSMTDEIIALKNKHKAIILAHNYQVPEVQDLGDFWGDSLELAIKAAETSAEVIVFCGVDFMAETAKLLSPDKKVLLPVRGATCPMSEMITPPELLDFKKDYPGAAVVSYANTTADVKAESDICCTSANAVRIVNSLSEEEIIFTPDRNLARHVALQTSKKIIPWNGFCPIHEAITASDLKEAKKRYPGALVMVHPECRPEVQDLGDFVVSTGQMFGVVEKSDSKGFIVGTESGIIYSLSKRFPTKEFFPIKESVVCPNMKKVRPENVLDSLRTLSPEINIPEEVSRKASRALRRMLEVG